MFMYISFLFNSAFLGYITLFMQPNDCLLLLSGLLMYFCITIYRVHAGLLKVELTPQTKLSCMFNVLKLWCIGVNYCSNVVLYPFYLFFFTMMALLLLYYIYEITDITFSPFRYVVILGLDLVLGLIQLLAFLL